MQKFTARGLESPGAQHFTDYTPQTTRSVCKARMRSSPMDCEIKKSVHRLKSEEKEDAPLLVVFQAFYSSLKAAF